MSNTSYICPLCGHEFALKSRQKTVKCGDHTLQVTENKGVLTVQVKSSDRLVSTTDTVIIRIRNEAETLPIKNVLKVSK
jgi:uncharacterized protein YunC (DUF1805 family)